MHEFSIAAQILECVLQVARDHGGLPVKRVSLDIGGLQQVVPDALRFAFEASIQGTLAEGATLEWREIPVRVQCNAGGREYAPDGLFWTCPGCGGAGAQVRQGDELLVRSVELEETADGV